MDYYYKGDPLGWASKAVENFAAFRKTIEDARERPGYVDERVNDNMRRFRQRSMCAMRYNTSVETIEAALSVHAAIRAQRTYFLYLLERVALDERDEAIVEHVMHMARQTDEAEQLKYLLGADHLLHDIEHLIRSHEGHARDAGIKPLQLRFLLYKISELEKTLSSNR